MKKYLALLIVGSVAVVGLIASGIGAGAPAKEIPAAASLEQSLPQTEEIAEKEPVSEVPIEGEEELLILESSEELEKELEAILEKSSDLQGPDEDPFLY